MTFKRDQTAVVFLLTRFRFYFLLPYNNDGIISPSLVSSAAHNKS